MNKKYFETPYLEVVRAHNDIITGSQDVLGISSSSPSNEKPGNSFAPDCEEWDEEYEW